MSLMEHLVLSRLQGPREMERLLLILLLGPLWCAVIFWSHGCCRITIFLNKENNCKSRSLWNLLLYIANNIIIAVGRKETFCQKQQSSFTFDVAASWVLGKEQKSSCEVASICQIENGGIPGKRCKT